MRPWFPLVLLAALLTGCLQTPDVQRLQSQGAANPDAPTAALPAAPVSLNQPDPLAGPTSQPAPVLPEASR
ncbi:MAG: hypothetical protein ACTHN5_13965 [Phycisphaerae bacterium]